MSKNAKISIFVLISIVALTILGIGLVNDNILLIILSALIEFVTWMLFQPERPIKKD